MKFKKFFVFSIFILFVLVSANNIALASNISAKMIEPEVSEEAVFEDENIRIEFNIQSEMIGFKLENKSSKPMKLIWNDVSIVLPNGSTSRVIKSGVRYMNKEDSIAPTTIPPGANISDIAAPVDNIYYSDVYSEWREREMLDASTAGSTFGIYLPIEINGKTKSYNFRFKQKKFKQKEKASYTSNITGFGGLSTPLFGTKEEQNIDGKAYVTSVKGINWMFGYTSRHYTGNGLAIGDGSLYYEYGTMALFMPYIGGGYSYRFSDSVIGSVGFPAAVEVTFRF